jgi:capsular polysaccharide biosynthesis protein
VSLTYCLRSARRNWWLLVTCAVVAAGATFWFTDRQTPEYETTLRLAVGPSPAITRQTRIAQAVDSLNKRSLVTTFAEIVGGKRILEEAVSDVGLAREEASRYSVSANALPEANVIALRVQGPEPETSEELAAEIAERAEPAIEDFYKNFAVRQLDEPTTPSEPVTPKPKRDAALAAAGGLALGFFLGLLRDVRRDRRRGEAGSDDEGR